MDQRRSAVTRVLAASFTLAIAMGPVAALDLDALSSDEVLTLQRRLVDAGCYPGLLDGQVSDALTAAVKACPDQDPVLRIETGMHTAPIMRIGVDAACTRAVTGSQDKTIRVWSLPDGRLLRTERLPIGYGNAGKLGMVAMSPDGRWVAAGGWDASAAIDKQHAIYLFDSATGTTVRRFGRYGAPVHHLAFSADGAKLAVALEGPKHTGVLEGAQGVRVLDVATGQELMADSAYGDDVNGVAFGPDGALYAVGYDGYIRRYAPDLKQTVRVATAGGKRPYSVAVDPAGKRLAVGYDDAVGVDILDASTLQRIVAADAAGINNGHMNSATWSADGRRMVAGATFQKGPGQFVVRIWNPDGKRLGDDIKVASNTVMALTPCRDAIAFATADPGFGLLRPDGTVVTLGQPLIPEMRGKPRGGFKASADGTRLHFGLAYGDSNPALFDLGAGTITASPKAPADVRGAVLSGLQISDWENTLKPMLNGKPIALDAYERARTIAVRDDRAGFALGTEFFLRAISADGTLRWKKSVPSTTWSVTLARGGNVVVAAYGDGTVRWHRWSDGQELLALFVQKNDKRWVVWTPSGYYMASPGAEDLIGWQINRGWEQPADFFPVSRFRARFNRPDIIRLIVDTLDEDAAVKLANDTSRRRQDAKPLIARLPPVIRITSPNEGARFEAGKLTVDYELRSPSGIPVTAVDVRLNGGLVARGLARADAEVCGGAPGTRSLDAGGACSGSLAVDLPQNDVEVVLIARAGDLASEPARLKLTWGGPTASRDAQPRPKLYALVIGVSDYVTPAMALRYAAKDARDFADAFNRQRGRFYEGTPDDTRIITDREVTRAGVVDGLEWLAKKVTDRDVGVVFFAGHGYMDDRQTYWFLPADATLERLGATAVSQDDINRTLSRLAGKALLFLDTCHAGAALGGRASRSNVDINQVINQLSAAENSVTAFASSTGREVSVERDDWRNGAFTKAIVEGLVDGRADLLRKGTITVSQLDAFVVDRVKDMTSGLQHPVMARPPTVPDFAIALVRY